MGGTPYRWKCLRAQASQTSGGVETPCISFWSTLMSLTRPNNDVGENLYMSSGRAAQEQAQGAVDSWSEYFQTTRIFSVPSWASYIPSCLGIFLGIQIKENIRKRCTREYISEFLVEQHGSFENVSEGTQRSRITPLEKNQAGVDLPLAISPRWLTMIDQVQYLITLTRQAFLKAQAITMMRLIIWM